jgi:pyruvate dehydrogenase E2 component (dihydrolipoamide acetyltransferase)
MLICALGLGELKTPEKENGMAREILLPQWGMEMQDGTIVKWLKQEGDTIAEGEPLVEVETSKIETELESVAGGVIAHILVDEGATVPIRTVLAIIADPGEQVPRPSSAPSATSATRVITPGVAAPTPASAPARPTGQGQVTAQVVPAARRLAQERGVDLAQVQGSGPRGRILIEDVEKAIQAAAAPPAPGRPQVQVVPAARRLAQEHGIDLAQVQGSGPRGRILIEDVEKAIQAAAAPPTPERPQVQVVPAARRLAQEHGIDLAQVQGSGPRGRILIEDVERAIEAPAAQAVSLTGMRGTIATRMLQSLQTMAQLTLTTEADVTEVMVMRQGLARQMTDGGLSPLHMVIKATARALKAYPRMNTLQGENGAELSPEINVGVAVALDEGLIVPTIRRADEKSLAEIAREARELAGKVREGRASYDDVTGGTFSITNLGPQGIDAFTPIVNPPQVGILGIGRAVEKPAVHNGEITKRTMMFLSLTFDHRIIDGAPAADFLRTVRESLEDPWWMVTPA